MLDYTRKQLFHVLPFYTILPGLYCTTPTMLLYQSVSEYFALAFVHHIMLCYLCCKVWHYVFEEHHKTCQVPWIYA